MQLMGRMQQMGGMQQMGMGGYFMPTMPQPQRFFTPAQIRAQPRWPQQQVAPRPGGMPGMAVPRGARPGGVPRMGGPPRPAMGVQPGPQPMTMMARPGMAPVPMAAGSPSAELQVYSDSKEPARPGDAG